MNLRHKVLRLILLPLLLSFSAIAQGGWVRKADLPGPGRSYSMATANGGAGYIVGGNYGGSYLTDHWQYNPATNHWTAKALLPGSSARMSAFYCAVNGKTYCGLGNCSYNNIGGCGLEILEYNPVTDAWTGKAPFPGCRRWLMASFVIGNKIYIATGQLIGSSAACSGIGSSAYLNDLWEYDPATDTWTAKAPLPGPGRNASAGFTLNGLGYVMGGVGVSTGFDELWQYNPATNAWAQKATIPTGAGHGGTAFSIGSYAYYVKGYDTTLWRYDPSANTWASMGPVPFPSRLVPTSFSIGNNGYVMTGEQYVGGGYIRYQDLWQYNPSCPANIPNALSIHNLQSLYCSATTIDTVQADSVLAAGISYQWQQSPDSLNYTNIPNANRPRLYGFTAGSAVYLRRIVTANAGCTDTSQPIRVVVLTLAQAAINHLTPLTRCAGDTVVLQASIANTKTWYRNGSPMGDTTAILRTILPGIYTVRIDSAGCSSVSAAVQVVFQPLPTPNIFKNGNGLQTTAIPGATYQWLNGSYQPLPGANQPAYTPLVPDYYSVVVTDSNGCSGNSAAYLFSGLSVPLVAAARWSVFPNPASEGFTVRNETGASLQVVVTNLIGSLHEHIQAAPGNTYFPLKAIGLTPGIYFLHIADGKGRPPLRLVVY